MGKLIEVTKKLLYLTNTMQTMKTTVDLLTRSNKRVQASVSQDKYGDYSVEWIKINNTFYSGKQIRTAAREIKLLEIIGSIMDLDDHFQYIRNENDYRAII